MTSGTQHDGLPFFRRFPGAVIRLSPEGTVLATNGRLERELGLEMAGRSFADLLDPESSVEKWHKALTAVPLLMDDDAVVELILKGSDTLPEPRAFTVLWDGDARSVWLLEHRPDQRLDGLREQVTEINSELTNTQRKLLKEQGRLSHALRELAEQQRAAELLTSTVQAQNQKLESQNEELLTLTQELNARGEELERSNRALDEFAYVISHDLKAPLRSISLYASWVEEDLGGALTEEAGEHLRRMQDRITRMRAMIEGVLAFARAGRELSHPEHVQPERILAGVLELLDPGPRVEVRIDSPMPSVVTRVAPLQQVFLNLLSNAIRYASDEEPLIRVGAKELESFCEFSVADNGPGIAPDLHDKIWTLFHTLEPEETAGGTGIGLAVVKKLVEAEGGQVWVTSSEGNGATFHFLWPRIHGQPVANETT
jgi:signal transduction histidine kinase